MEELYVAKYNGYWYLSFAAPAVIMLLATLWKRRWILVTGLLISLPATYLLRVQAVVEKWDIRNEIADTPEEKAYAHADGANLLFESILSAPLQSILLTALWMWAGKSIWGPGRARHRGMSFAESVQGQVLSGTMSVRPHPRDTEHNRSSSEIQAYPSTGSPRTTDSHPEGSEPPP